MSSKKQSSSKPHGSNCVKPFDAKSPPKKGQKKHVFIPKINVAQNYGWTQIPFDIAKKSKEEILASFEEVSKSYLEIQEELLGAWKEIEDDKNSKQTMTDSQNEIIENSKQFRKNNIQLQIDLQGTIKNAQENYACAKAKEQECKNLTSKNEKLVKEIDIFTKTLADKNLEIIRLQENEIPFNCNTCDAYFRLEESLNKHKVSVHEGKKPEVLLEVLETSVSGTLIETLQSGSSQETKKLSQCILCGLSFTLPEEFLDHVKIVHEGKKHQECDKAYQESLRCKICSKKLPNKVSLNSHMKGVHGPKKFECDICHKKFSVNDHLKSHKITHTVQKLHSCNSCPKEFRHKSSLKSHIKRCKAKVLPQDEMTN